MIEVRNLTKIYSLGKAPLFAVRDVSFSIAKGEILGLVGESGCGKSTLARMLLRLTSPTSGEIFFEGKNITSSKDRTLTEQMQMIFQDPFSSLNPRMTIQSLIDEPLLIRKKQSRADELLDLVGLPQNAKGRFPHEFSGGQRQRIGIARALALNPSFIVCDEPISALDVSIQAQIVNLLCRLQKELHLTYLFIAHDLAMVRHISTKTAVMYLGEFVEYAPTESLYRTPRHPYTQLLFSSIPQPIKHSLVPQVLPKKDTHQNPSSGCPFAPRCPLAMPLCHLVKPALEEHQTGHFVACHIKPPKDNT